MEGSPWRRKYQRGCLHREESPAGAAAVCGGLRSAGAWPTGGAAAGSAWLGWSSRTTHSSSSRTPSYTHSLVFASAAGGEEVRAQMEREREREGKKSLGAIRFTWNYSHRLFHGLRQHLHETDTSFPPVIISRHEMHSFQLCPKHKYW